MFDGDEAWWAELLRSPAPPLVDEPSDTSLDAPAPRAIDPEALPCGYAAMLLDAATAVPGALGDGELVDAVVALERIAGWAQATQARLLAEFADRRPPDPVEAIRSETPSVCSRYAPDEIGLALRWARGTARVRVERAVHLRERLPGTLAAWERGELDASKVGLLCDATAGLRAPTCAAVEARVLTRAAGQTRAQLQASVRRAVIAADGAAANERHAAARRDRRVVLQPEVDGMAVLWASLPAPDAVASYQWLSRLARSLGPDDPRGMDARRADLLTELVTGRITAIGDRTGSDCSGGTGTGLGSSFGTAPDSGGSPGTVAHSRRGPGTGPDSGGARTGSGSRTRSVPRAGVGSDPPLEPGPGTSEPNGGCASSTSRRRVASPVAGKPLVHVVVAHSTLVGADDSPAELTGYGPVPADLARSIAADAVWKRLVTDPLSGALLDHGRTTYRPPAALADFVAARDVHCRSPICRRRATDGELDHALAWEHGGGTDEANLHALCTADHHRKHAPGWSVAVEDGRTLTWITPTGHRYSSHPHDYRDSTGPPPTPPSPPPSPGRPPDVEPAPF
jgi:hypothetical protein